jgi:hypothetical protein
MDISRDELAKRKLFIATPMYGGMCHGAYTQSMVYTERLFKQYGLEFDYYCMFNESLIQRARNYCADAFLRSNATHLLFIDSDIEFNPHFVLSLLAIADPESDKDIVVGAYPKKNISWEKVVDAVNQGFADKNPNLLEEFIADFVFNLVDNNNAAIKMDEPVEISEAGTGFMMIQKKVFGKIAEKMPEIMYKPDHVRTKDFDGSRKIGAYFHTPIDPNTERYLSEDYYFCQQARKHGSKVWLCPWMTLNHMGYYKFKGNMGALAALGASPTFDANKGVKE